MYILKISPRAFIIVEDSNDIIITPDYLKATQYRRVGDAMRAAASINSALETSIVKVQPIN
jgi:hypothetical protein